MGGTGHRGLDRDGYGRRASLRAVLIAEDPFTSTSSLSNSSRNELFSSPYPYCSSYYPEPLQWSHEHTQMLGSHSDQQ